MKPQTSSKQTARRIAQGTLALAALTFGACSTTQTKPAADMAERHGQVQFSSASEQIVGEIAIRHDQKHFYADITKGPGVPLLKISARFGTDPKEKDSTERQLRSVSATGPLAHGGWTWRPSSLAKKSSAEKLKDSSRAWAALPEVFMWGEAQAKGEAFRVCLPDIVMHARVSGEQVKRFDYSRHENPTGQPLALRDLKKQQKNESVICHLD